MDDQPDLDPPVRSPLQFLAVWRHTPGPGVFPQHLIGAGGGSTIPQSLLGRPPPSPFQHPPPPPSFLTAKPVQNWQIGGWGTSTSPGDLLTQVKLLQLICHIQLPPPRRWVGGVPFPLMCMDSICDMGANKKKKHTKKTKQ